MNQETEKKELTRARKKVEIRDQLGARASKIFFDVTRYRSEKIL